MTRSLRLAVAMALCAGLAVSAPTASSAAIPKSTRAKLHDRAVAAAKALKEPKPTSLRAVRTTYGKVKSAFVSGPSRPASTAVYVIAMNGRFVDAKGRVYHRYDLVLAVRRLKAIVAYLGVPYPAKLGATTRI
jgi:hypothetical protein